MYILVMRLWTTGQNYAITYMKDNDNVYIATNKYIAYNNIMIIVMCVLLKTGTASNGDAHTYLTTQNGDGGMLCTLVHTLVHVRIAGIYCES